MGLSVALRTVGDGPTALGSAGPFTLVADLPVEAGGGGLGFNGGQLLYLAIGACISNDLYREAATMGIELESVRVRVRGDFAGDPPVSTAVEYEVEISGDADPERLRELVDHVDRIAEIPNSLRGATPVKLGEVTIAG